MNETSTPQALVTAAQLAEILQVRPRTITRWESEGILPSIRINSRVIRFDADEVLQALRETGCAMTPSERQATLLKLIIEKQQELAAMDQFARIGATRLEQHNRRVAIVLAKQGWVHTSEFANCFPVTNRTIERDLNILDQQNLIERTGANAAYTSWESAEPMAPDEQGRRFYARLTHAGRAIAMSEGGDSLDPAGQ